MATVTQDSELKERFIHNPYIVVAEIYRMEYVQRETVFLDVLVKNLEGWMSEDEVKESLKFLFENLEYIKYPSVERVPGQPPVRSIVIYGEHKDGAAVFYSEYWKGMKEDGPEKYKKHPTGVYVK